MEPAYFRDQKQESNQQLVMDSSCYGLSWNDTNLRAHELAELQQLSKIKDELLVTGSFLDEDFLLKNDHHQLIRYNDNNQDMLIKTLSNGCQIKSDHLMNLIPSYEESIFSTASFSQIFPPLKFSNLNQPASYPTFNGSFNCQPSSFNAHNLGHLLKANCLSYGVDQIHSKIVPTFIVETKEAKRPARNDMDAKAPNKANPTKKSKLESCTQLKVRKEKLGDRILALQQMVAPFGKTDTASVLMEAIGYIKFLHNQVETLSIPYMNSTPHAGMMSTKGGFINDGDEETKRDLRSRGLCLVPLSCLTYITYGGGSVWATL